MNLFGADMENDKAVMGSILLADGLACLREVRGFIQALAKGGRRHG